MGGEIKPFPSVLRVVKIGKIAKDLLSRCEQGKIFGLTSRGLFLQLSSGWILFLSFEESQGPLTLTLLGDYSVMRNVKIGSPVICNLNFLKFPGLELSISISDAEVWSPLPPPSQILSKDHRLSYLDAVYGILERSAPASPIIELLPFVLDRNLKPGSQIPSYLPMLQSLQLACDSEEDNLLAQSLSAFLGLGKGLTPSGDDLVIGFLLGVNRWAYLLQSNVDVEMVNSRVIEQARSQTTTISLNLIECACSGQADERLVLALDGLMAGNIGAGACVNLLAGWGNTSGFDSLTGMALFSLAFLD